MRFFDFFMSVDSVVLSFTVVYISLVTVSLTLLMIRRRQRDRHRESIEEDAFKLLTKGFTDETINNERDIRLIFQTTRRSNFIRFLERYIISLRKDTKLNKNLFLSINDHITKIIDELQQEKPFSDVPAKERMVLCNIHDAIARKEYGGIDNFLTELSNDLVEKQSELESAKTMNKWTVPISVVGVLLTGYFGLFGSSRLSTNDLTKISESVSEQLKKEIVEENSSSNAVQPADCIGL